MSSTPRFALPFLTPGQAQKELYHNEALQVLDVVLAAAVEDMPQPASPDAPAIGSCFIVGDDPTGEWTGEARHLAAYTVGGWRFVAPTEGLTAFVRSTAVWGTYRSGAWEFGAVRGTALFVGGEQVVGARAAAIPSPTMGTTVDSEARTAVDAILAAMRQHGLIET